MKTSSQKQPNSTSKSAPKSDALRILFADDETSLQELIAKELPRMGHSVTVCPDGIKAVQALSENAYDCLLVDLDTVSYTHLTLPTTPYV